MTLPIPPSDSLYKFTAIGGLILVVLSMYVPWKLEADLKIAMIDIEFEIDKAKLKGQSLDRANQRREAKRQVLNQDYNRLSETIKKKISEGEKALPRHSEVEALKAEKTDLDSKFEQGLKDEDELLTMAEEGVLVARQLGASLKKQQVLAAQAEALISISIITGSIGILLTIFGFSKWYFNFQVHQDRIIKAQAEQWTKPRTTEREKEEIPG